MKPNRLRLLRVFALLVVAPLAAMATGCKSGQLPDPRVVNGVLDIGAAACHVIDAATSNPYVELACEVLDKQTGSTGGQQVKQVTLKIDRAQARKLGLLGPTKPAPSGSADLTPSGY